MPEDPKIGKIEFGPSTGFVQYTGAGKFVEKSNTLRYVKSMTNGQGTIALEKPHVLFTTAEEMEGQPASCYNCRIFYDKAERCAIHLPSIVVKKFVAKGEGGKDIEFWPCCGYHDYGEPSSESEVKYQGNHDGDSTGLVWINAPEPGLEYSGANCGGVCGGDDCDLYLPYDAETKWDSTSGLCRVLQSTVGPGDVCTAWQDDDVISWRQVQSYLKEGGDLGFGKDQRSDKSPSR